MRHFQGYVFGLLDLPGEVLPLPQLREELFRRITWGKEQREEAQRLGRLAQEQQQEITRLRAQLGAHETKEQREPRSRRAPAAKAKAAKRR